MAQNQLVQARVSREVKDQATAALADMGLTVSDAVRILLTRVAREKRFPLDMMTPNAETLEAMEEARNYKKLPSFGTIDELMADLNADD